MNNQYKYEMFADLLRLANEHGTITQCKLDKGVMSIYTDCDTYHMAIIVDIEEKPDVE